jgi:hypothetical protein
MGRLSLSDRPHAAAVPNNGVTGENIQPALTSGMGMAFWIAGETDKANMEGTQRQRSEILV